jgi:hypothetical protein
MSTKSLASSAQSVSSVASPETVETVAELRKQLDTLNAEHAKLRAAQAVATYPQAFDAMRKAVRWSDVIAAAAALSALASEASKTLAGNGKPSAIARKIAVTAPSLTAAFRFALSAYCLAKPGELNPTQKAELASKLPELVTGGKLTERAVTFGGIALPPLTGEL